MALVHQSLEWRRPSARRVTFMSNRLISTAASQWFFAIGMLRIEARIWLEPGANTAYAAWRLLPGGEPPSGGLALHVRLMVDNRDHNGQTAAGGIDPRLKS